MATTTELESQQVEPFSTPATPLQLKDFIWSEDEWPTIRHDEFYSGNDIPVISLAEKGTPRYSQACKDVVEACATWGIFKLVDHGVPTETVDAMTGECSRFFDLSMEQKARGARSADLPLGYSASNPDYSRNLPWAEIVQLLQSPPQIVDFSQKVYQDQHKPLSDAMLAYMGALDSLGMAILEMLAHGLGLEDGCYFTKNFKEKESTMIRVNRYPPCPLPDKCLGLGSHSDPHSLTILLQDEVGGLQVMRGDGEWVGVRPVPNSFVVNVGDTLEAWTNGRVKSVVHRAVVNEEKTRLSVAYFLSPASDALVECPSELLGGGRRYLTFTWAEFRRELLLQRRVVTKTAINRYLISSVL